jgi:hypothetical protein
LLLGAAAYALAPWLARGSSFILAEALMPAMVVSILWLMVRVKDVATPVGWALLGFAGSVLPMFRPDMLLLIVPLAIWCSCNAPRGKRLASIAVVVAAFAILPLSWGFYNLFVRGFFQVSSNAGWYAAWSGLGMVPNPYGYQTNDMAAITELRAHGLSFLSTGAESYWRTKFLAALVARPYFVLKTIFFRASLIISEQDYYLPGLPGQGVIAQLASAILLVTVVVLSVRRRYAQAFIVAGPMLYALFSLGFLYVEPRYVRYASISYLLSIPILLQTIWDLSAVKFLKAAKLPPRALALAEGVTATTVAVAAAYAFICIASILVPEARAWAFGAALRSQATLPTHLVPSNLAWLPEYPGGENTPEAAGGVRLTTTPRAGDLYRTLIQVQKGRPFFIRMNSILHEGKLNVAVYNVTPPRNAIGPWFNDWAPILNLYGSAVDDAVLLVLLNRGSGPLSLSIKDLELAVGCSEDRSLTWLTIVNQELNPYDFAACPGN